MGLAGDRVGISWLCGAGVIIAVGSYIGTSKCTRV